MSNMQHDYDCVTHGEYYTSDCGDFCDYTKEAKNECLESGEHLRMIVPENGNDICFNCGASA